MNEIITLQKDDTKIYYLHIEKSILKVRIDIVNNSIYGTTIISGIMNDIDIELVNDVIYNIQHDYNIIYSSDEFITTLNLSPLDNNDILPIYSQLLHYYKDINHD